jgi:GT2 family glycosyltransferase
VFPDVSIVVPCHDEPIPNLAMTLDSLARARDPRWRQEIIVVDDGSLRPVCVPRPVRLVRTRWRGAAAARNTGAVIARGQFLVFLDAHCLVEPGWIERLVRARSASGATIVSPGICDWPRDSTVGYGMTLAGWDLAIEWLPLPPRSPAPIPIAPGACLLVSRRDFFALGGFDDGLRPWGYEDVELSIHAWLAGGAVAIDATTSVRHRFRSAFPSAMPVSTILRNAIRVADVHFSPTRAERVRRAIAAQLGDARMEHGSIASRSERRRAEISARRRRSDDWLFRRFGMLGE